MPKAHRLKANLTIAVLGSTGATGVAVVRHALESGHLVRALARTPEKLNIKHSKLKIITGNANDLNTVTALLTGCDAVISTLGPGFDKSVARNMVSTSATRNVIQAMKQLGLDRYIVMSGASVVMPGDRPTSFANLVTRYIFPFLLGDILRDKYSEYELLKNSDLNWTLVRCPRLWETDTASNLLINKTMHKTFGVEKEKLAEFLVSQATSDQFSRQGIFACSQR